MEYGDRLLDDLVAEAAEYVKDPHTGYIQRKDLIDEVQLRLEQNQIEAAASARLLRASTETQVDKFFNRRKPKPTAQGSIYEPNYLLPLGDGKRVFMRDASVGDLIAYRVGVEQNQKRVNNRAAQTYEYIGERITALNENPGRSLGWVERHVFGYEGGDGDAHIYEEDIFDGE